MPIIEYVRGGKIGTEERTCNQWSNLTFGAHCFLVSVTLNIVDPWVKSRGFHLIIYYLLLSRTALSFYIQFIKASRLKLLEWGYFHNGILNEHQSKFLM